MLTIQRVAKCICFTLTSVSFFFLLFFFLFFFYCARFFWHRFSIVIPKKWMWLIPDENETHISEIASTICISINVNKDNDHHSIVMYKGICICIYTTRNALTIGLFVSFSLSTDYFCENHEWFVINLLHVSFLLFSYAWDLLWSFHKRRLIFLFGFLFFLVWFLPNMRKNFC